MIRRLLFSLLPLLLTMGDLSASESLFGRVLCGYQGWFNTPGDGANLGWRHYGFEEPGQCHLDLWPDLTGFGEDELHDTPLRFSDDSVAQVFSSANAKTTLRHFEWMRDHGIDGVFLQRFGTTLRDPRLRAHNDAVLANVRAAAEATGRSFCIMYDLSGLKAGEI
ncbi:MAG: xylosidase/arabinosidase, partial [Verrucomicrobiales bacterium]